MNIAIYGAGSTGCYLGGLFSLCGHHVTLICRPRIQRAIQAAGAMTLTDYAGQHVRVTPDALISTIGAERFDCVFVTLKCHQLEAAIIDFVTLANRGSVLYFMQNGLGSLDALRVHLPEDKVKQGITPFNVLSQNDAHFHRGTEGTLIFERTQPSEVLKPQLEALGFPCDLHSTMQPVIYGKLLLNLNNAINALSNLPIKTQLENRALRKVIAGAMEEWLAVATKQGIALQKNTAVKPAWLPIVLRLPNFIFKILAQKMLTIDPHARSSMWEDIQAGRKTEIEFLNGAVVREAEKLEIPAPINRRICDLIIQLEQGQTVDIKTLIQTANTT